MTNNKQILTSEEIKEIFLDYVQDKTYNYAMMLDGDWGSGKTYFVKKELIPYIEKNKKKHAKKTVYISLYGIKDSTEITKNIYMEAYLKSKFKKKFAKVSSIGLDILFEFIKDKGIGINQEKTEDFFKDFLKLDNTLLIFDDLERCKIPVNEVLGFINGFVEHSELKVIIITNEKEIGSTKENSELDEEKQEYLRIKEKLVGNTLVYTPNIENTLLQLISPTGIEPELKSKLINKIPDFISTMESKKHINFRTFQFYLSKISKIYNLLYSEKITENESKDEFMDYIVRKTFSICCELKQGEIKEEDAESLTKAIEQYYDNKEKILECIKIFIETSRLNVSQLRKSLDIYHDTVSIFAEKPYQNLQKLKYVCDMTEEDVIELIKEIEHNIEDNRFQIYNFSDIVYHFLRIEKMGFSEKYLNKIIESMKKIIDDDKTFQFEDLITNNQYITFPDSKVFDSTRYSKLCQELQNHLNLKDCNNKAESIPDEIDYKKFIDIITTRQSYKGTRLVLDIFSKYPPHQVLPFIAKEPKSVIEFHGYITRWENDYLYYSKGELTSPMGSYKSYLSELDDLLIENDYNDIILRFNIKELKIALKSLVGHIENEIKKTSLTTTK